MKRNRRIQLISILCLVTSAGIYSLRSYRPSQAQTLGEPDSEASNFSSINRRCSRYDNSLRVKFPNLIENRCIVKFNGSRLKLYYDNWEDLEDRPYLTSESKIVPFSSGGLLVALGDTLYRLDESNKKVWAFRVAQAMIDFALVESTNLIYGTSGDNTMFILDATTGQDVYFDSRNGSAAYGVTVNYGEDMCLVTDNFWFYRQDRSPNHDPMNDGITCWRGTTALWHMDFPPDAELIVNGRRILAVTRTEIGVYVKEIIPPPS